MGRYVLAGHLVRRLALYVVQVADSIRNSARPFGNILRSLAG